jgi:hypothetical protein
MRRRLIAVDSRFLSSVMLLTMLVATPFSASAAEPAGSDELLGFTPVRWSGWGDMGPRTDGSDIVWTEQPKDPGPPERRYPVLAWSTIMRPTRMEIKRGPATEPTSQWDPGPVSYSSPDVANGIVAWIEEFNIDVTNSSEWGYRFELHATVIGEWQDITIATAEPGMALCDARVVGSSIAWLEVTPRTTRMLVRGRDGTSPAVEVMTQDVESRPGSCYPYEVDGATLYWIDVSEAAGPRLMAYRPAVDAAATPVVDAPGASTAPGHLSVSDGRAIYRVLNRPDDEFAVVSTTVHLRVTDLATKDTRDVTLYLPETSPFDPTRHITGPTTLATNGRYIFARFNTQQPGGSNCCIVRLFAYDLSYGITFELMRESNLTIDIAGDVFAWRYGHGLGGYYYYAGTVSGHFPTAPVTGNGSTDGWFPETHHLMPPMFWTYWQQHGGLPVFGYPLSEEFEERNQDTGEWHTVQFTERQRFERHPENVGTPYDMLLGRLGAELLKQQGRDWTTFPTAHPTTPHYVDQTGHAIDDRFWEFWSNRGLDLGDPGVSYREAVALFGYPLSEAMVETNADGDTVLTQYFERAVFEHHPENPPEWQVLLRRLGAEVLSARGW